MKSNALFTGVGKLSHLMPSVSAEVTGSEQCSAAGVSLDKVREGKEKVSEANKGNGYGQFRAIEVKRWGEAGYYLSLLLLTGETRTGEKKDGWLTYGGIWSNQTKKQRHFASLIVHLSASSASGE